MLPLGKGDGSSRSGLSETLRGVATTRNRRREGLVATLYANEVLKLISLIEILRQINTELQAISTPLHAQVPH